jgi:uncharacterized protein (DUF2267 family)
MKACVAALDQSMQKTNEWLNDLTVIGAFKSEEEAYSVLRIVLHKLRDSLSIDLVAHLGAQFPLVIAGLYYSGWHPASPINHEHRKTVFLNSISEELEKNSNNISSQQAIKAVYKLLQKRISPGLIKKIKQAFPRQLQEFWPQNFKLNEKEETL